MRGGMSLEKRERGYVKALVLSVLKHPKCYISKLNDQKKTQSNVLNVKKKCNSSTILLPIYC